MLQHTANRHKDIFYSAITKVFISFKPASEEFATN